MSRRLTRLAACAALFAHGAAEAAEVDVPPDGLVVTPTVRLLYDDNVLRANDTRVTGSRSDLRVTPSLDVTLRKVIGRSTITVRGTGGYDVYRRFSFLNRERIQGTTDAVIPFGGRCQANPRASINFAQANLADQGIIEGNSARTQDYELELVCLRSVGFFPQLSGEYLKTTNSATDRRIFNVETKRVSAGLGYTRPSLGDLLIIGSYERFNRPRADDLSGGSPSAETWAIGAQLRRAVAPRLSYTASFNYFHVNPLLAGVPSYSGLGWRTTARWAPSPRASLDLALERSAQNQSNVGAVYVVETSYRLAGRIAPTRRSRFEAGGSLVDRRFRGELQLDTTLQRRSDSTKSVFAGYHYALRDRLQAGLELRREWRTGGSDFFHYTSNSAQLTLGLKL